MIEFRVECGLKCGAFISMKRQGILCVSQTISECGWFLYRDEMLGEGYVCPGCMEVAMMNGAKIDQQLTGRCHE